MEGKRDNEEKGQGGHEEGDLCGKVSVKGGEDSLQDVLDIVRLSRLILQCCLMSQS